jgi:sec-independent protein translocase protein TatC
MSIFSRFTDALNKKAEDSGAEMSFFQHLEQLRWHLIRAAAAILLFTIFAFIYFDEIFDNIILAPTHHNFWTYRMMCNAGHFLHSIFSFLDPNGFCVGEFHFRLINTELAGQFNLQLNTSIMIGLILGVPYLLYEIWKFIRPALHDKERNAASGFVFYSSSLFLLGVFFGYYIVTPLSIRFLATYKVSDAITNMFSTDSIISSETMLVLISGIVFQLPIVVYILASLRILTPAFMRRTRRYSTVIILVIAAIITPSPDALTMLVVAMPLFVLYEFSIMIAALVERRKKKREAMGL